MSAALWFLLGVLVGAAAQRIDLRVRERKVEQLRQRSLDTLADAKQSLASAKKDMANAQDILRAARIFLRSDA